MTDPVAAAAIGGACAAVAIVAGHRLGRRREHAAAAGRVAWLAEELGRHATETAAAGGNPDVVRPYLCRSCGNVVVTADEIPVCVGVEGWVHDPVAMGDLRAP